MRTSLRVKITLLFLIVTSFSLSFVGFCNYQTAKDAILQSWKDNAQTKARMQSQQLSTWIATRLTELKLLSHTDQIRFGDDESRMDYLIKELGRSDGDYFSFGFIDQQGMLTDMNGKTVSVSEDPYFLTSKRGYEVISDPYMSVLGKDKPIISIQVPVYNHELKNEQILYGAWLADEAFKRITGEMLEGEPVTALLVHKDGTILLNSPYGNVELMNRKDIKLPVQNVIPFDTDQAYGTLETTLNSEAYLLSYAEVSGTGWRSGVLAPMKLLDGPLSKLFWMTVGTVSLTEMALGLIMFILLGSMLGRLRNILGLTENVAGGNLKVQPIHYKAKDEIGALAHSVNGMVDNLRTMFERLNAIINQNDYVIIVVDPDGLVTYFNRKAETLLGYKAAEVMYRESMFLWHDEAEILRRAERLSSELGVRIPPDISVFLTKSVRDVPENYHWTFVHKDGSKFPVNLNVTPMRDPNGSVTGYVAIAHEIRLYKHAEETRNRLLSILDAAKDLIASVDDRGYIFYINPAGMELLEMEELNSDTNYTKDYFEKQQLQGFLEGLHQLHRNGYWERETVLRTRSGREVPMSMILVAHKDKQGKAYYSVIARDILEQKRIQRELVQAKQVADQANEAKTRFLARMSHEIRTPLNGIIGFTQLMMRTGMNDIQQEYGHKIVASSHTLLRIVNDILDFSKVEAGKIELERTRFSLNETVCHICDMISVHLGKEAVEVFIDTPEQLPSTVIGDPLRLEQVLLNLCSNALKFTKQGYILVKLELLRQYANEVLIEFTVEDSGIGMNEEQLTKIFEPFRQADDSTSRKYGGTGLGLVISKSLIDLMGGTLHVHSRQGEGTRFTFQLPFEVDFTARNEILRLPYSAVPYSVLVIQQSSTMVSKLHHMLQSFSLQVTMAPSWHEGYLLLQNAKTAPYHLVLMDMEAEDMYGVDTWLDLHERIRSAGSISIAMTTAYGREELLGLPEQQRPDWVIVKPINRLGLYQMLHAALEGPTPSVQMAPAAAPRLPELEAETIRGHILLAEDNELNQQVAVEMLKSHGYATVVASNGLQLLEKLELNPTGWDVILMDIQMPEMDGYEAARIIRADSRFNKLPIIALTADVLPEQRETCFTIGINAVMNKPMDMNELAAILQQWAPDKEAEREAAAALPELVGIDVHRLLDHLNGKVPIALHVLRKFYQDYADFAANLQELLGQGEQETVQRSIHSLKGVAANMAADRLFAAASSMEGSLKAKRTDGLEQQFLAIKQEVDTILLSMEQAGLTKPDTGS
ncbi:ATP-binding protein [Paenibacillus rigui]|uniref:Circadian input-output histidine kinase CikA n=1 Tax=Paenibacillus rigui TaxID=554312 RepID=A0A229UM52_9BACL|nr:ATP-binding protein [Paenibacillus rigui]OXM84375.1 hypothetical protein CF651_21600 [Paenibacillus rigui]